MKIIATLVVILSLYGCATGYKPVGAMGGFSSTQLDENVFTVSFKGNGYTGREKANDFALLRSAEITLEHGFKYFIIVDAQQYSKNSSYTTPTTATTNVNSNTYGNVYGSGNSAIYNANTYSTATTTVSGGQTYVSSKPRTSNTIICLSEKPEDFSYDAEFIAKSLKEKHGIYETPNK